VTSSVDHWTAEYRARVRTIGGLIQLAGTRQGDRIFIKPDEPGLTAISFRDLEMFVEAFADFLNDLGISEGERVIVLFHNSTLMMLLFLAVIGSSRVLVPLNPKSGVSELDHIFLQCKPAIVLFGNDVRQKLDMLSFRGHRLLISNEAEFIQKMLARRRSGSVAPRKKGVGDEASDAEIVFTSGSTGLPKGVVLSHRSLLEDSHALGRAFRFAPDDRFMTVCPLFHNSGQIPTTLAPLWCGAQTAVIRSDFSLLNFWHLINRFQVQWTLVMNAYLALLLARQDGLETQYLKGILAGGSRLSADLIRRFESRFGVRVYQAYGLTETTSIASCETPFELNRSIGSAGKPLAICDMRIDSESRGVDGRIHGEILIRGSNLLTGYLNKPEETHSKLRYGWLHTGDTGYFDDRGNLFVLDRIDNMMIVGGENMYPSEIEQLIPVLNDIDEALVVAVPHRILGDEPILVYKLRENGAPNEAAWREVLGAHLSTFKIPKRMLSLESLQLADFLRAPNGKILRNEMRQFVCKKLESGA
jgi:long-chain acyl-CoA synthetase